jgi:hypothetical protein
MLLRRAHPRRLFGVMVRPLNFTARIAMSASATIDPAASHEELAALFQSSENYYMANWSSGAPKQLFTGFNWAAFFFGATWLLYRRLWKGAAVYFLAVILLGATLSGSSFILFVLVFRLALGSGANSYYFREVKRILAAVRKESLAPAQHLERLKARGGTSATAVVIAISAYVMLRLVFFVLPAS